LDFEFSAEQEMLRSSVRALLADTRGADASVVWNGLRALDVVGLGMVDSAVVLEELGRAVSTAPYASTAIGAVSLLGAIDPSCAVLPSLLDGSRVGTVALFEEGLRYSWRSPTVTAVPDGDAWRVTGTKVHVCDAPVADVFVVTACDPTGALGVFLVEGALGAETEQVDVTRSEGRLDLAGTPAVRLGAGAVSDVVARVLDRLGVALVVDGVGAAQRALELAVEYAKEREQFGKPIGSFQAVQHLCADMLRTVELGRAAAYYACWAVDDASADEAHRAAVMAQAFAAEAFPELGGTAIQVFGGIGFTWEHEIHRYYKRLLTVSVALGSADDHLAELANLAID
jgi:acyl-CoA dehydrogenase